jgi:hypothetical protein
MDHGDYVYFLNGYAALLSALFFFFRPTFRRVAANQVQHVDDPPKQFI